ncbi:MAG: hypothetical protein L6R28_01535 [Planctomycetes bacterium]|nr:hypothetical protein [Planctomycetota bacterium]
MQFAMRLLIVLLACAAGLNARAGDAPSDTAAPATPDERLKVLSLSKGLRDEDLAKVKAAVDGLVAVGTPLAAQYLAQLYSTGDAERRVLALEALAKIKLAAQPCEQLFQASLEEPLLGVRRKAADALVFQLGRNEAAKRYIAFLEKFDPRSLSFHLRAVQQLAHAGGEPAPAFLKKLLNHQQPEIAAAAAEALAVYGDVKQAPALIEKISGADKELKPALADALKHLTGENHGADLVAWEAWNEDFKAGRKGGMGTDSADSLAKSEDYKPDYVDAYKVPADECAVDFVVVFDTTKSLLHIWPEASAAIDAVLRELAQRSPSLRMAAVRYRADSIENTLNYLIQPLPFTRDAQKVRDFVTDATFGGGSGGLHRGLEHAIQHLAWRSDARKAVLVVGDVTPLGDGLKRAARTIREGWTQDRIQFNMLYIRSLHGEEHIKTYRELAKLGGGRFYEYNKAWRHLVDLSLEKFDPKVAEQPGDTFKKWLTPVEPPAPLPGRAPAPAAPKEAAPEAQPKKEETR